MRKIKQATLRLQQAKGSYNELLMQKKLKKFCDGVVFTSKNVYNLNRNILLLSTVTEQVLSTAITN